MKPLQCIICGGSIVQSITHYVYVHTYCLYGTHGSFRQCLLKREAKSPEQCLKEGVKCSVICLMDAATLAPESLILRLLMSSSLERTMGSVLHKIRTKGLRWKESTS